MKAMRKPCGAVALELALTLGFLFPVAAMLLFYGRVLYNYEVAQKAAHDAVRHMASANVLNINNNAMVGFEVAVAQAIAREEVSVLNPSVLGVSVSCDGVQCLGLGVPTTVTVSVQIKVRNQMYGYAPELADQNIIATQSMRYVGN